MYLIIVITSLFGGCSNDFGEMLEKENEPVAGKYLDCSDDLSPEEELIIIDEAFQRIEDHFVVEDDICYLTVYSAKDMNMSDAVFGLVKKTVNRLNMQYEAYSYFKNNTEGIIIRNPFELKFRIATPRAQSEMIGGPQMMTKLTILDNQETITVLNAMRTANITITFLEVLAAGGIYGTLASTIVTIYGGLTDAQLSKIQDDYARSGSTNGITLKEVSSWSPTTGIIYPPTYRAEIN